jgi:hypothetical protein
LTASLASASQDENIATGTTILTAATSDAEGTVTYSISGGDGKFTIDSSTGEVTLASSLEYETSTSHTFTITASDGVSSSSETYTLTINDIDLSLTASLASASQDENIATGTTILTAATSDAEGTVTYSISGGDGKFTIDSSTGEVTLASSLEYETSTSHTFTITASDGVSSSSETYTLTINDIDLSLTASLASASQDENIATGTTILTAATSDAEGTVTYSISGGDGKFTIDSSTGEVTLASSLDYETSTSHTFTITASDGVSSSSETYTLTINDVYLNNLSITLSNSGIPLGEDSSSGTAVGTTTVNNPDSSSVTYSISGAGSDKFSIDSSGNITTTAALDFEAAKSFELTVTADSDISLSETITINIQNIEELESGILRYSANYSNVSQNSFAASASRDNNNGALDNYKLDTIVTLEDSTNNSRSIDNYISSSSHTIPVSTETTNGNDSNGVSKHEIQYTLPVNSDRVFAPNESSSTYVIETINAQTDVSTSGADTVVITAGHTSDGDSWFMSLSNSTASALSASYVANGLDYSLYGWLSKPDYNYSNYAAGVYCYDFGTSCPLKATGELDSINFSWEDGNILGVQANQVLLIITGQIVIPTTEVNAGEEETIYFNLISDDGQALEVDGEATASNWRDHGAGGQDAAKGSFTGIAGQAYDIEVFMYENQGWAALKLYYSLDSISGPWTIAPTSFFYDPASLVSSTYDIYAHQVMMGGEIFTDIDFYNFTGGASPSKRLVAFAAYPRENVAGQWWYPNFIPSSMFAYSNVAPNYCTRP